MCRLPLLLLLPSSHHHHVSRRPREISAEIEAAAILPPCLPFGWRRRVARAAAGLVSLYLLLLPMAKTRRRLSCRSTAKQGQVGRLRRPPTPPRPHHREQLPPSLGAGASSPQWYSLEAERERAHLFASRALYPNGLAGECDRDRHHLAAISADDVFLDLGCGRRRVLLQTRSSPKPQPAPTCYPLLTPMLRTPPPPRSPNPQVTQLLLVCPTDLGRWRCVRPGIGVDVRADCLEALQLGARRPQGYATSGIQCSLT